MKKAIFLDDAIKLLEKHLNGVLDGSPEVSVFTKSVYSMACQHCINVLKSMPVDDLPLVPQKEKT